MESLKRTIVKLFNNDTGEEENSLALLSQSEESNFQLRRAVEERIQSSEPLYSCGICGQPVVVRSHTFQDLGKHIFYFKHQYNSGDCPIKTATPYSKDELLAMKYNGAKESKAHLQIKQHLVSQLEKDPRFSNIEPEKVIKGNGWSKEWKKPDVSALFNGKRVVFEVQLSTTFLEVIVKRESFYRRGEIPIFWIFRNLAPEKSRATEKDIFFNNKANALSIDDQSKELTLKTEQLVFTGHYKKPTFLPQENRIAEVWETMPVTFDDIKFDARTYKPYFISFDSEYQNALEEKHKFKVRQSTEKLENIVIQDDYTALELKACCKELCDLGLYNDEYMYSGFLKLLQALLSVRDGRVYIHNQEGKWTWLVNYIWEHHKQHWVVLLYIADQYERRDTIFDKNNQKLTAKRWDFQNNWNTDERFKQETTYYPLLSALFPKISKKLKSFTKRLDEN